MREDFELLKEVYKTSQISSKTLGAVLSCVENASLRQTLIGQIEEFDEITRRAGEEITALGEKPRKRVGFKDSLTLFGTRISAEADPSLSNVAQIVSSSSGDGATNISKAMNDFICSSPKVYDLARRLVATEEKSRNKVKSYL